MTIKNIDNIRYKADKNLLASILRRNKLASCAKRVDMDDSLIYTIGVDNPDGHLNGVFSLDDSDAEELLDQAIDFFSEHKRDFIVWIRDHADSNLESLLKARSYTPMREPGIAGMYIEKPIEERGLPLGYTLKKVETLKGVADYAKVVKEAFNKDQATLESMFSNVNILIKDDIRAFILYKDDEPVAASTTLFSDDLAGIYYLGTIEGHRSKGIGSYMTSVATNAGFDMGANTVILQASQVGEPIYKKLGYKVMTHYRWYKIDM